ncbi:hypothetical protein CWIS_05125, partial [Cellulomonas sp. A375-1]
MVAAPVAATVRARRGDLARARRVHWMPALPEPRTGTGSLWFGRRMLKVLAAVAALVVSVGGGWWFVSAVLRLASRT